MKDFQYAQVERAPVALYRAQVAFPTEERCGLTTTFSGQQTLRAGR
jgi:hypothetical protein